MVKTAPAVGGVLALATSDSDRRPAWARKRDRLAGLAGVLFYGGLAFGAVNFAFNTSRLLAVLGLIVTAAGAVMGIIRYARYPEIDEAARLAIEKDLSDNGGVENTDVDGDDSAAE